MADQEDIKEGQAATEATEHVYGWRTATAGGLAEEATPAAEAEAEAVDAGEEAKGAFDDVVNAVSAKAAEAAEAAKPVMDGIAAKAGEALEAAKPVMNDIAVKAGEAFEAAKPAVESAAGAVKSKAEELLNIDIDGDGVIGTMSVTDAEAPAEEEASEEEAAE